MQVATIDFNTTEDHDRAIIQGDPWSVTLTLWQDKARTQPFDLTVFDHAEMEIRKDQDRSSALLATPTCEFLDVDDQDRGFLDLGMARQPEIVVRAEHDDLLAVHRDHGILGRADLAVHQVVAGGLRVADAREVPALLEDVQALSSRAAPGSPTRRRLRSCVVGRA